LPVEATGEGDFSSAPRALAHASSPAAPPLPDKERGALDAIVGKYKLAPADIDGAPRERSSAVRVFILMPCLFPCPALIKWRHAHDH